MPLAEMSACEEILASLHIDRSEWLGGELPVFSPIDGERIASLRLSSPTEVDAVVSRSVAAFQVWRNVPAPKRGELVRCFGEKLRAHKESLARLVTLECGKILEEGRGEVQEMIDICDFAVGLSRQLHGLTIASERPNHSLSEVWHPLGPTAIISAFNFPVAVWAWNAALALVCGNSIIWKPSEKTPLTAIACQQLLQEATEECEVDAPEGLSQVVVGLRDVGERLVEDRRVALVSATGSCRMGAEVAPVVAERFGRSILELGGNNAAIVTSNADLDVALPSILFGAVGTAGQRCTTTRRLFVHESLYETVCEKLKRAYRDLIATKIGSPLEEGTLIGPLVDRQAYEAQQAALAAAKAQGAEVLFGERVNATQCPDAFYVEPALVLLQEQTGVVRQETFAPILYVMPYKSLDQAIELNNSVTQGLSSAIFTTDLREAARFTANSDCGIANVNIGTSGAEIGGAFGGEKETGGGRESGSDAWKQYMRRQTTTQYHGVTPPDLAQGIRFGD